VTQEDVETLRAADLDEVAKVAEQLVA